MQKKENFFPCSSQPHSDTDTQNYVIYFTLILRLPSLWTLPLGTKLQNRVWTMKEAFLKGRGKKFGARHHARARMEKENLSSFLARPSCSSHDRNPLFLPFRTPARVRMTRHACPTLCGDRIRLLCFGFSTLSHLSNFRFL